MSLYRYTSFFLILVFVGILFACQNSKEVVYDWSLPTGFPKPAVPEDNPMTAEKVALGRHLFYDTRLSGNQTQSCASCHQQQLAFSDGVTQPIGSTGDAHFRNSISLVNIAYNSTLTWSNPMLDELEEQILIPMFGEFPVELGLTGYETTIIDRFESDPLYQKLFADAYTDQDDPINLHNTVGSLSSFVRSIISGNSRYDQYVYQQDKTALTDAERRGMDLFFSEELECHHCHIGFNFSGATVHEKSTFSEKNFQNNGLYNVDGEGAYPASDTGLYDFTGNPNDMGKFRPASLRNVGITAPYMHDGSIATLEEVIEMYANGGRDEGQNNPFKSGLVSGFVLSEQEKQELIQFLHTLTDESLQTDPRFSDPFIESTK